MNPTTNVRYDDLFRRQPLLAKTQFLDEEWGS